jgi:parallel beta-helix repeat protein
MEAEQKKTKAVISVLALAALVVFSLSGYAGKLEPSAPPGPTMKTLDEVEPRIPVQSLGGDANSLYLISQPGSYYLAGNITGEPNKGGIMIAANNVTVDLMGFGLIGVPGSQDGICVRYRETDEPLPMEEVTFNFSIRNGTICNWGSDGIDAYDMFRMIEEDIVEGKILVHSNSELLNVSAHNNGSDGIRVHNALAHMEDVSFCNNGGNGVNAFNAYLTIEGIDAHNNDGHGMCVDGNSCCHMEDVSFTYNGGNGLDAYNAYLTVEGIDASKNDGHGLYVGGNSYGHMEDVSFTYNVGNGMHILGMMTNLDAYSGYASHNGGNGMFVKVDGEAYIHMEDMSLTRNDANGLVVDGNSCCHLEDVSFTYNAGNGMHILGMMTNVDAYSTTSGHNGGNGMYVKSTGESYVHMEQVSFNGNNGNGVEILGMMTNVDAYSGYASHNGGGGIIIYGSGNLNQCAVVGNSGSGIEAGIASNVRNCTARGNTGDGIVVSSRCYVVGNTCENNGEGVIGTAEPAGIRATGGANRIDDNHVTGNNVGIDIDAAGNLIINNSATANTTTNYEFAVDNTVGPTVGSSDIVSSSNPHANYEY